MRPFKCVTTILMVISLFGSAVCFAQKDLPLNPGVKDALYLLDTDQPDKATSEIQKVVASLPTDASLLYYLGYIQMKAGDKSKALESFEKGIALNANEPLNYVGKGHLNMLDKKPADAKVLFDKALSMSKSKSVAVLKGVAEGYNVDSKYSVESVALLNKAKSINDQDAQVLILLGDTYFLQNSGGNVGQSVTAYESAQTVKADPKTKAQNDAKAEYKIGMLYERAKNNEVALEDFLKSIKAEPGYTFSYRELGQLYYLKKEYKKAVESYEKFLSLTEHPQTPVYQYEYAFFLFADKNYAKANPIFEKVISGPDVKPTVYRFYWRSLFESGDFQKANDIADKYLQVAKPEDIDFTDYQYYGQMLQKLNKDTVALIYYQKSIDLNKNQPDLLSTMANISYKYKKFDKAIGAYKQIMSLRKTPNAQDFYSIGRAYYSNNQFPQADTAFTKFIELQPTIVSGYFWEARTKSQFDPENDKGLAKPFFEKVIELGTPEKNKNELIEAYGYMGYYHFLKKDVPAAKAAYKKVLELNPNEPNAKSALETLDKVGQAPPKKK